MAIRPTSAQASMASRQEVRARREKARVKVAGTRLQHLKEASREVRIKEEAKAVMAR